MEHDCVNFMFADQRWLVYFTQVKNTRFVTLKSATKSGNEYFFTRDVFYLLFVTMGREHRLGTT